MRYLVFLLFFFILSCTVGVDLKPLNSSSLLDDNSSKVWLINHLTFEGIDYATNLDSEKEVFVFYKSGTCFIQIRKNIGTSKGKKYRFSIEKKKNGKVLLMLKIKSKKYYFKAIEWKEDLVVLEPINKLQFKYTIEIIPLPEPSE